MIRFAEKIKSAPAALAIALVVGMGALSGCSTTSGTKVEQADIAFMVKGKTKKPEVISKLGPPSVTSVKSDGSEQLVWMHNKSTVDGKSFIPFVGLFAGGGSSETKTLTAEFDKKGLLTNHEWSSGGANSSMGMK